MRWDGIEWDGMVMMVMIFLFVVTVKMVVDVLEFCVGTLNEFFVYVEKKRNTDFYLEGDLLYYPSVVSQC